MATYLFLSKVAEEHSIDYFELRGCVFDVFTRDERHDIDPEGKYIANTRHFNRFVKEHKIQEVNVDTVVLYLKGVKLAVSNEINSDLSIHLEDANKRQNQKIRLIKGVLIITSSLTFAGFLYFF